MASPYFWINLAILFLMGLILAIGFRSLPDSPRKRKLTTSLLVLIVLLLASTFSQNIWPRLFDKSGPTPIALVNI